MGARMKEGAFFDQIPRRDDSDNLLLSGLRGLGQFDAPRAEDIDTLAGISLVENRLTGGIAMASLDSHERVDIVRAQGAAKRGEGAADAVMAIGRRSFIQVIQCDLPFIF